MNNLNHIATHYPALQEEWKSLRKMVRDNEYNVFKKHVKTKNNVLEVGLGDGGFLKLLAAEFKNVLAVDGSSSIIESVKRSLEIYKNIEYMESYIESLKLSSTYDNIVMSHILEHIEEPVDALINIKNIMNEESIIYICVPNADSIHRQVAVEMGLLETCNSLNETDVTLGHYRVYTPSLLKEHVEAAGIEIVASGGSMLKPLSNGQMSQFFTPEMIEGFIAVGNYYPELCGDIYIIGKKAN